MVYLAQSRSVALPAHRAESFEPLVALVPPATSDDAALLQLRRTVFCTHLVPSQIDDLPLPQWDLSIREILLPASTRLPAEQLDRGTMRPPQPEADTLLYAAAVALHGRHRATLDHFWHYATHPLACLWRTLMVRRMPSHKRTQVAPRHAAGIQEECLGISQSSAREAYCSRASAEDIELVELIRSTLPQELARFSFSSIQLNRGLRPILHRGAANVGGSVTIALGPYAGGTRWQTAVARPTSCARDVVHFPPWTWTPMDGAALHAATPFCGQQCSSVLFLHEAALAPLPPDVLARATALHVATFASASQAQFVAAGTRGKTSAADWPFRNAISEAAEATLEVANLPLRSLVQHFRVDAPSPVVPTATHVVPRAVFQFLLLACLAAVSSAEAPRDTLLDGWRSFAPAVGLAVPCHAGGIASGTAGSGTICRGEPERDLSPPRHIGEVNGGSAMPWGALLAVPAAPCLVDLRCSQALDAQCGLWRHWRFLRCSFWLVSSQQQGRRRFCGLWRRTT